MKPDNFRDERFRQELVLAALPFTLEVINNLLKKGGISPQQAANMMSVNAVEIADGIIEYMNKPTPQDGSADE